MRIIDADILRENVLNSGKVVIDEDILECDNVHEILVYLLEKVEDCVVEMIDEQPTAYHLDKVVKELEEQAEECRKYWQNFDDEDAFGGMNAYCHAIRIVKRGGFNE